jgi:hypothetical protein
VRIQNERQNAKFKKNRSRHNWCDKEGTGGLLFRRNILGAWLWRAIALSLTLIFMMRSKNVNINPDTGEAYIERNPTTFTWAFSLQYSLMYLQSFVKDIGLGALFKRMIIVAEFPMQTNLSRQRTDYGDSKPGVV